MTEIIIIVLLIAMSAFFSGSETAFSTVNKIRLKNYAAQGNKRLPGHWRLQIILTLP